MYCPDVFNFWSSFLFSLFLFQIFEFILGLFCWNRWLWLWFVLFSLAREVLFLACEFDLLELFSLLIWADDIFFKVAYFLPEFWQTIDTLPSKPIWLKCLFGELRVGIWKLLFVLFFHTFSLIHLLRKRYVHAPCNSWADYCVAF